MTTTPRRRVIRPPRPAVDETTRQRKLFARRAQLESEQDNLSRWMSRMKRAFHAVEKQQKKVARLERELERMSSV